MTEVWGHDIGLIRGVEEIPVLLSCRVVMKSDPHGLSNISGYRAAIHSVFGRAPQEVVSPLEMITVLQRDAEAIKSAGVVMILEATARMRESHFNTAVMAIQDYVAGIHMDDYRLPLDVRKRIFPVLIIDQDDAHNWSRGADDVYRKVRVEGPCEAMYYARQMGVETVFGSRAQLAPLLEEVLGKLSAHS